MSSLKDLTGYQGFNHNIARDYLKGKTIEFCKPPYISWSTVMPYSDPDDIARISNEEYLFRTSEPSVTLCVSYDHDKGYPWVDDTEHSIHNIRILFDEHGNPDYMERI